MRETVYLKEVSFADGTVLQVESEILKAYIIRKVMDSLLPFDEGLSVLESQFPQHPISGFIQCCFEWIMRYTYVQHNYLLFAFKIPDDDEVGLKLGRKCVCMINKYTYEIYLCNFRFSEDVFKGTLLDGILIKDNCIYPDFIEFTLPDSNPNPNTKVFETNSEFAKSIEQYKSQIRTNSECETIIEKNNDDQENEKQSETTPSEIIHEIITDKTRLRENYENVIKEQNYNEIFKQQRMPARHMFYVQAVYQMSGIKTLYSNEKLVDSISYKTLLTLQQFLFNNENWINDGWFQPFELKNCVDTMYYTRHTQVDLRNPFHNDYLRYQPVSQNDDETVLYDHFLPRMAENGKLWKEVYYLSGNTIDCYLNKTDLPYVYELVKTKKNTTNNNETREAKIMTLEQRRYIRVILNKIHNDRTKPLRIMCKRILKRGTNEEVGWTPVLYGSSNMIKNKN